MPSQGGDTDRLDLPAEPGERGASGRTATAIPATPVASADAPAKTSRTPQAAGPGGSAISGEG